MNTDGRVEFCLVGDPVVTSLALPVALDALDDMIYILNKCETVRETTSEVKNDGSGGVWFVLCSAKRFRLGEGWKLYGCVSRWKG